MATSPNAPQANPAPRWIPLLRNFEKEQQIGVLKREQVAEGLDPLSKFATPAVTSPSVTKQVSSTNLTDNNAKASPSTPKAIANPLSDDPLSASSVNDPLSDPLSSTTSDPLSSSSKPVIQKAPSSANITSSSSSSNESKVKVDEEDLNTFIPWKAKKASILSEFTTDETLGVTVSFIEGADSSGKVQAPVDRTQQRLAQIEQSEEYTTKQTLQMNQKEWEKHIEKLHEDLITAWNGEERVKSLKIAIQANIFFKKKSDGKCAKLLGDTSVIKFYPSKYVLITEILDTFGRLVYERIATKTESDKKKERLVPDLITEQARETCRNWFYKIASIRELLPRLYVEMAIIRCYEFIQHNTFPIVINRIASQIKGVGDPLIGLYARSYLVRKGYEVAPDLKDYLLNCLQDFVSSLQILKAPKFQTDLTNFHLTAPEYHHIFEPALDWILQCIGHNASMTVFDTAISYYRTSNNPVLLKHIISSFKPAYISSNARLFAGLIRDTEDVLPKYQLYTALGVNLVLAAPPKEDQLGILNEVWKVVTKWEDVKEYVTVTEVFIEYPLKYFSPKEVNVMLGDLLRHIKENSAFEKFQPQLHSIVQKVVANSPNFSKMFTMENFIALLDLFSGETQNEVNKSILAAFAKNADVTSDPLIIQAMISIGKAVHDSVNSLSFQDEIRQISKSLISFIHKVDFGMDLEKHLNFFVECRKSFGNFDSVKYNLVLGACNLAMRTLSIVKGKHTKKTSTFVRACIGFCYITIPSMDDYFGRLNLYLLCGQVALQNQALPQADSFLKSAIKLIQEVPAKIDNVPTEENLIQFTNTFCSLLIAVPGHPEQGPFYLVKGLLKVIGEYPWEKLNAAKARIFLNVLALFSNYTQPKFPYRFKGVDSNDILYGGDQDYIAEIQAIINKILDDILEEIAKLKSEEAESSEAAARQGKLALDLFNYTLVYAELTPKSATLAVKLYELAKPVADPAYLRNSIEYLRSKEGNLAKELLKKLIGS